MRKLHVMSLIADYSFGGPATRLLGLARAIDRSRFDYTLASIKRPDSKIDSVLGSLREEIQSAGFRIVDVDEPYSRTRASSILPHHIARSGLVFGGLVRRLARLIRALQVDVLDSHLLLANLAGSFAGRLAGIPTVSTLYYAPGWKPFLPHLLEQAALGMSSAVVTDSRAQQREIRKWMFRDHPLFPIIPNPIYAPESSETAAAMRARLGLPADPKVRIIGQISRMIPSKGFDTLVSAAALTLREHAEAAFLLVGHDPTGGTYRRQLEQETQRLGIGDRVRVLAYPGPIGDIWKAIDIHAHPTLLDSLPSVIIEGMSLGKPAVVTSVAGIPEMVENNRTALVVPPGNAVAFARALLRLLKNPDGAHCLGAHARRLYEERYSPEVLVRQFEYLFSGLVYGHETSPGKYALGT